MDRPARFAVLLLLVALAGGLATAAAGVLGSNVDRFVTASVLVICGGLLATGVLGLVRRGADPAPRTRIPAGTVLVLGLIGNVGGALTFDPWTPGITRGLRMIATAALMLVGTGLVLAGWHWARRRRLRLPLASLATGLVLGLAYIAHQRFHVLASTPLQVSVVVLAILVAVAAARTAPSSPSGTTDR